MTELSPASCKTCKFSIPHETDLNAILCRRFPPTPLFVGNDKMQCHFPVLNKEKGWCAEYLVNIKLAS